jgi:Holliday junction resolvase RusA-like endonuclease
MNRIQIKPLSVNKAWKGRRYKTDDYKQCEHDVMWLLPKIKIPEPPFEIRFKFGFSSKSSDWDNPVKPLQDILSKKYGFDDKLIRRAVVDIEMVNKGQEYAEFDILNINEA